MSQNDSLGNRMKEYEATSKTSLLRRTPVIIRVDGRAFHTFTRRIKAFVPSGHEGDSIEHGTVSDPSLSDTPFSVKLHEVMNATAATLFHQIQTSVFVYTQSDEISILLRDWDRHETQQWFGGGLQKIVSLSASITTAAFNYHYQSVFGYKPSYTGDLAHFDARVFNIPKEEVVNYFIWRQQDASRNSVQMYGRHFFSQKQMHGKTNSEVQDMLMLEKGKNWNDLSVWMRRGSCVYAHPDWNPFMSFPRALIDDEIPIFTQDRQFVERHLTPTTEIEFPIVALP